MVLIVVYEVHHYHLHGIPPTLISCGMPSQCAWLPFELKSWVGAQVAHERSSVELQAVCMEVAGDCLPNVVVSFHCLHLLWSSYCCLLPRHFCKSAKRRGKDNNNLQHGLLHGNILQWLHDPLQLTSCLSGTESCRVSSGVVLHCCVLQDTCMWCWYACFHSQQSKAAD